MNRPALALALALGIGLTSFAQTAPQALAGPLSGPFPKGERAPVANFTGVVYVATLVKNDATFNCASSNVTFTPGARSHWHTHAAGQILLVTEGVGYYQEKGQPIRLLRKGEVVQARRGALARRLAAAGPDAHLAQRQHREGHRGLGPGRDRPGVRQL